MGGGADAAAEEIPELPLRPVLVLTEEELLALTGGDLGMVPARLSLPTDPAGADLVRSVALRSLMARGFVMPGAPTQTLEPTSTREPTARSADSAPEAGEREVRWQATEPLGMTLHLRHTAPTVLILDRVLGTLRDEAVHGAPGFTSAMRYLHLHHDLGVIEDVTPDGMHGLLTVYADRFEDAIADFILPPDAVAGQGEPRRLRNGGGGPRTAEHEHALHELLESMGVPPVLVEAAVLRLGGQDSAPSMTDARMLALGPGGCFSSTDSVTYHPVEPRQAVRGLLDWATGRATMGA